MMIGSGTEITPHDQQAIDELGQGQLELADQNPAWGGRLEESVALALGDNKNGVF